MWNRQRLVDDWAKQEIWECLAFKYLPLTASCSPESQFESQAKNFLITLFSTAVTHLISSICLWFDQSIVDKLIHKHSNNIKKQKLFTLFEQNRKAALEQQHLVPTQLYPQITNSLQNSFQKANMKLVFSSNNKLCNALGSTKDPVPLRQRSGIYEISCSGCDFKYIGQTKRALHNRVSEHLRTIKNRDVQKAIPAHIFDPNNSHPHKITSLEENVKLIKIVNNSTKLDTYESIYISKTKNLMNLENGPIESPLFKLI